MLDFKLVTQTVLVERCRNINVEKQAILGHISGAVFYEAVVGIKPNWEQNSWQGPIKRLRTNWSKPCRIENSCKRKKGSFLRPKPGLRFA